MTNLFGWTPNQDATDNVLATLPRPLFATAADVNFERKDVFLYDLVRKVKGSDLDPGPQGIGDCVSWGYAGGADALQCISIAETLQGHGLLNSQDKARDAYIQVFEELSTEAIYALMRCEVGKQWNSYSDGAVGAWAAKASTLYGYISRKELERNNMPGKYDKNRAKQWGAKGLPDNLEPIAKKYPIKTVSLVKSFDEAAAAMINYLQPTIVCSNRGFSMRRDAQGFCAPDGTWYHCMKFLGVRWDRPGLLCLQSWGPNSPTGPLMYNQPTNSFWVDAKVADYMLRQGDSFTIGRFEGYKKANPFNWDH